MNFANRVTILYNNLGKGINNLTGNSLSKLECCVNYMSKYRYNI